MTTVGCLTAEVTLQDVRDLHVDTNSKNSEGQDRLRRATSCSETYPSSTKFEIVVTAPNNGRPEGDNLRHHDVWYIVI